MADDLGTRLQREMERIELRPFTLDDFQTRHDRRRRNQRLVAGAVGMAVFVAAIWIVTRSGSLDQARTPAAPGVGTGPTVSGGGGTNVTLPPVGAEPSTPETGELIITMHARPGDAFPSSFVPVHQVWVYADGRVITRTEGDPPSYAIEGVFEQRLTPEGVDLLLSRLLSTGLFEHDGEFTTPRWGSITVRSGDRKVSVGWGCVSYEAGCSDGVVDPTARQRGELVLISEGLADLVSWLPASAWETRDRTAYVPSRYAICYRQSIKPWRDMTPSEVSSELPRATRELLRGKDTAYDVYSTPFDEATSEMPPVICSEVTLEEAQALQDILIDGGFSEARGWRLSLSYQDEAPDPIGVFEVAFEPILPHGRWELMPG